MSRQGASDNEVGDYCDYGDYEDVGTPVVPTRVGFLTHHSGDWLSLCNCSGHILS